MKMSALKVFTVQVTHCEHTTHLSYTLQGQSLKSFKIMTCNRPSKHKDLFKGTTNPAGNMTKSVSKNNTLCQTRQIYLQVKELAVSPVDDLGSQVRPCYIDDIDLFREKKAQVTLGSEAQDISKGWTVSRGKFCISLATPAHNI